MSMPRPRFPSDKRAKPWSDSYAQDCDRRVAVCLTTLTSERDPAKRLRIASGLLRLTDEIREHRNAAIVELRERGWTWRRISSVFGVSISTAHACLNRTRPFPHPEKTDIS